MGNLTQRLLTFEMEVAGKYLRTAKEFEKN